MSRYFETKEQAATFRMIATSYMNGGAYEVGLTGSRAVGEQVEGVSDVDVIVIGDYLQLFEAGDHFLLQDETLPDGTVIPPNFQVMLTDHRESNPEHPVGSMKAKAKWWYKSKGTIYEENRKK